MKAIEFKSQVNSDRTLTVPVTVMDSIPIGQTVRVLVLFAEKDTDLEWEKLTAEDFGQQQEHLAAIGEEVAVAAMIAEHAVAAAIERGGDRDGVELLADACVGGAGDAPAGELIEQHLLEAADRQRETIVIGERRGAVGDRDPRRRVSGPRHAGSGLSARSSAAQNSATATPSHSA